MRPERACAKCGQPVILGHCLMMDGRSLGELCCMCGGELLASFSQCDRPQTRSGAGALKGAGSPRMQGRAREQALRALADAEGGLGFEEIEASVADALRTEFPGEEPWAYRFCAAYGISSLTYDNFAYTGACGELRAISHVPIGRGHRYFAFTEAKGRDSGIQEQLRFVDSRDGEEA